MHAKTVIDLIDQFNQKQDERGPENVIRAGADGILSQLQERFERIKAALIRGQTTPEELRANALDIAGFGIILTMILDGTWKSPDGRVPSKTVASGVPGSPVDDKARAFLTALARNIQRDGHPETMYAVERAAREFLK